MRCMLLLLSSFFMLLANAQESPTPTSIMVNLKGKVKQVSGQSYTIGTKGEETLFSSYIRTYNEKGQLIRQFTLLQNYITKNLTVASTLSFLYDEGDKLTKRIDSSQEGIDTTIYTYNTKGYIQKAETTGANNSDKEITTYAFNDKGALVLIETLTNKHVYTYLPNGKVHKDSLFVGGRLRKVSIYEYPSARKTYIKEYAAGQLINQTTQIFNVQGDMVHEEYKEGAGLKKKMVENASFVYDYKGNWINRKDISKKYKSRSERTISYY